MILPMLANGVAFAPTSLNPVKLFLDADYVVQAVMIGLVLASIWTWTIIIGFSLKMGSVQRGCDRYEKEFWEARDIDQFQKENKGRDLPSVRVVNAALAEWRRSTSGAAIDREGTRQRLTTALDGAVVTETDALASRLNFLATVGSVRSRTPRSRSWHRAFPKHSLPPPSASSPPSRPALPTTASRTA
jgi:biopolymer transport protein TolQ